MQEQRLKVISKCEYISKSGKKLPGYLCECKCGNTKVVSKYSYDSGKTRSCGCLIRDFNSARGQYYKTSVCNAAKKFGVDEKVIRNLKIKFKSMKGRCYDQRNRNYQNYGGRGIRICDEWLKDIETFIRWALESGYEKGKSIDRIDVDGNYEPSNCRWSTSAEQARDTRRNVYIKYNDEIYTVTDLAQKIGIDIKLLSPLAKKGIELRGEV
jgi:hypothetical protein